MHGDLIGEHRRQGLAPLAEHALRMATRLAAVIGRQTATAEEAMTLARALVRLGGFLQRSARLGESDLLFEEALRLDPAYAEGRLRLAVNLDRLGRRERARNGYVDN